MHIVVPSRKPTGISSTGSKERGNAPSAPIIGVEWVLPAPCVLAALIAPADLVFWDSKNDVVLHVESLTKSEVLTSLLVDPWDASTLVLASMGGTIIIVQVQDLSVHKLKITPHSVALSGAGHQRILLTLT